MSYLIAATCFVWGLKLLSKPETARKGNFWAAAGMVLAMITTLFLHEDANGQRIGLGNIIIIVLAVGTGTVIGIIMARRVKITAMPEMVSFFNATGGLASALVGLLEYPNPLNESFLVILLGVPFGSIAFTGSIIAYLKLSGKVLNFPSRLSKYINAVLLIGIIFLISYVLFQPLPYEYIALVYLLFVVSLIYGVLFVMPIGGADMPVVISLLNSQNGVAAAMAGFIFHNLAMILGGVFVGAAGSILTLLMCKAMNRSLWNVIGGGFGVSKNGTPGTEGTVREVNSTDAAILLAYSHDVIVVPGYGLAVAQAQHVIHELETKLEDRGIRVRYGIHPVAGRMPGHMNVLLAEADVPYEKLVEMDDVNKDIENADVVVVVGANDVVNLAANENPGSPIYGMPVINAADAKHVIVLKRGAGKGYAGIENPLFFRENTHMLYGNAKDSLQKLITEINTL
jgi:NAD(P) transhydrogenase subunit beta